MINIIKSGADAANYAEFIKDYNRLVELKDNKSLWNTAIASKNGSIPLLKSYFDSLHCNKFNYISYKKAILGNSDIYRTIIGYYQTIRNSEIIRECLQLHLTIETYIGFMVEYILAAELREKTNNRVIQNNILDFEKKADLLYNGSFYQIKNCSFLHRYRIDLIVAEYKAANKYLQFIFYEIAADNIYFLLVDNKPFLHISEINGFSFAADKKRVTIDNYIKYLG